MSLTPLTCRLLLPSALLALAGIAGIARSEELAGEPVLFAKQQPVWASLALLAAMTAARTPLVWWRKASGWFYLASLACLALAHVFPAVNGAHRWIRFGPFGMQPSELAKLATILLLARTLAAETAPLRGVAVAKALVMTILPVLLILAEPNLGTAALLVPVAAVMLWTAGLSRRQAIAGLMAAACLAPLAWPQMSREQRSRITAMFHQNSPNEFAKDDGYQLSQAKQVRALGGWTGSWLAGDATDDRGAYRLPEARTDFIFSVLGERFGLCGLVALMGLYCLLIRQGIAIALAARDPFSQLLATGVTALFAVEAVVNAGMNVGLLPVAGLSLPLVSYGGSGMLVHGAALGLLWNVGNDERGGAVERGTTMTPDDLDMAAVLSAGFVRHAEHHASIGSTNDRARELTTEATLQLPLLVVANLQTAGRGRGSNRWWTGEGSLAMSVLLDPAAHGVRRESCGLLSLATAIAIVETLEPLLPGSLLGLHWPNDVFAAERKIAGILVEALRDGRHVVGLGLNVNNSLAQAPAELQDVATTLLDLTGRRQERQAILQSLLANLSNLIAQLAAAPATIGRRCNELCLQHGRELTLEHGQELVTGPCQGVADDGALLLQTPGGLRKFYAGALRRR